MDGQGGFSLRGRPVVFIFFCEIPKGLFLRGRKKAVGSQLFTPRCEGGGGEEQKVGRFEQGGAGTLLSSSLSPGLKTVQRDLSSFGMEFENQTITHNGCKGWVAM